MKWIGQHIWDSVSRFRNDVYLDSPTAGGSDPDKFLGIDTNSKIIYRTGTQVLSDIGGVAPNQNTTGSAATLTTERDLQVNLASTSADGFDGGGNADNIGVSGTLPLGNGGTGNTTGVQSGKSYRMYNANFRDDIATTKHYLPLKGILEQTALTREEVSELSVCDGRIVSVTFRAENLNTHTGDAVITFGVETNVAGVAYDNTGSGAGSAWTVIETEALTVQHTDDEHVFHYVFDTAKHWDSTDMWAISIESDVDMAGTNERFFVTVVVEDDWSTYLAGSSRELTTTP